MAKPIYFILCVLSIVTLESCATRDRAASDNYIIYLHGSVEEEVGSTDKYEMAVDAIKQGYAKVITEVRGSTNPMDCAQKLNKQVNDLLRQGIVSENITIAGYSKGAVIALAASTVIKNPEINYVLLAGCSEMLNEKYEVAPGEAAGRFLSIYDVGDEKFGSCQPILEQSEKLVLKEVELDTGKGHKLFRIPKEKFIKLWRDPLLDWAGA